MDDLAAEVCLKDLIEFFLLSHVPISAKQWADSNILLRH